MGKSNKKKLSTADKQRAAAQRRAALLKRKSKQAQDMQKRHAPSSKTLKKIEKQATAATTRRRKPAPTNLTPQNKKLLKAVTLSFSPAKKVDFTPANTPPPKEKKQISDRTPTPTKELTGSSSADESDDSSGSWLDNISAIDAGTFDERRCTEILQHLKSENKTPHETPVTERNNAIRKISLTLSGVEFSHDPTEPVVRRETQEERKAAIQALYSIQDAYSNGEDITDQHLNTLRERFLALDLKRNETIDTLNLAINATPESNNSTPSSGKTDADNVKHLSTEEQMGNLRKRFQSLQKTEELLTESTSNPSTPTTPPPKKKGDSETLKQRALTPEQTLPETHQDIQSTPTQTPIKQTPLAVEEQAAHAAINPDDQQTEELLTESTSNPSTPTTPTPKKKEDSVIEADVIKAIETENKERRRRGGSEFHSQDTFRTEMSKHISTSCAGWWFYSSLIVCVGSAAVAATLWGTAHLPFSLEALQTPAVASLATLAAAALLVACIALIVGTCKHGMNNSDSVQTKHRFFCCGLHVEKTVTEVFSSNKKA